VSRPNLVVVASLFLASAAGISAEAQDAPPTTSLYFTSKVLAVGGVSGTSVLPKVFDATMDAPAVDASQKAYANAATGATAYPTAWAWKTGEPFQLSGQATISTWVSCDVLSVTRPDPSGNQLSTMGVALQKNGADITGTSKTVFDTTPVVCTGPSSIRALTVVTGTADAEFKAGDTFGVRITMWALANAPEANHKNIHFLVGSTKHPSRVSVAGLPGALSAAPGPSLIEDTLEGTSASIEHAFDNATSDTYRFNWTANLTAARIEHNVTAANGSVQLRILDGASTELVNATLNGTSAAASDVENATAGNWTVELSYSAFQGTLSLTIGAVPPPAPTANETADGNQTEESGQAEEHKNEGGIPSVGIIAVALAASAGVAIRRRRA